MPRQPRCDAPGVVHHVWARGIDGRAIFLDDDDRRDLIARLDRILPESGMRCLAWALMSNHLHLVLRTGAVPISSVMKRIHTGFAIRFNRRSGRCGYLFQSRFGSRMIGDDADLLGVIVYVLRNPIDACLVRDVAELERYPWSACGALLGRREPYAFESVRETLSLLGGGTDVAHDHDRLRSWIARERVPPEPARSLEDLVREVCRDHAVAEADLRAGVRVRPVSRARAHLCKRAVFELGLRPTAVARALGLAHSAVSAALRK